MLDDCTVVWRALRSDCTQCAGRVLLSKCPNSQLPQEDINLGAGRDQGVGLTHIL